MLLVNSLTEIANKITPKTFLIICIPLGPRIFSILFDVLAQNISKIHLK